MSTIASGHLEVNDGGQERPDEAGLVRRREAVDLRHTKQWHKIVCPTLFSSIGFRCSTKGLTQW